MEAQELPIILTYAEELKYVLERATHDVSSIIYVRKLLDSWENSDTLFKEEEEEGRMWDLVNRFSDECRDNYLRIHDEAMAIRYRNLLRNYFGFIDGEKTKIDEVVSEVFSQFDLNSDDNYEWWFKENKNTYFDNILHWACILESALDATKETIIEYESYLPGSSNGLKKGVLSTQKPSSKLIWNDTNRTLYDLFAQLSLADEVKSGQPLIGNTIAGLARFISENVDGMPSAATVQRELEKMREPQGIERVKRGRIYLDISRDHDAK